MGENSKSKNVSERACFMMGEDSFVLAMKYFCGAVAEVVKTL